MPLKRISTGIYRDAYGIRAIVDIAAGRKEKRFDFDHPLKDIKRWRNEQKTKLERLHPQKRAGMQGRRTFSAAMKKYLKTLAIASWKSRRSELRAWEKHFLGKRRSRITQDDVKRVIKTWFDDGVPPKTVINRVRALTAMYHALDGDDAWTPADGIVLAKPTRSRKPFVAAERIIAVEQRLREQTAAGELADGEQWRGRYMVMSACGARPVHVKRAKPSDVDLERRVWSMGSAKDGEPIELYLNDEMLAAWEVFVAADAFGPFDATEYARIVRAAGWPEDVKPYATKHTVGRELGERGVDMQTIADWFGHADLATTREFYVPVLNSKIRKASELMNGRLGWRPSSGKILADDLGRISEADRNARLQKLLAELTELIRSGEVAS